MAEKSLFKRIIARLKGGEEHHINRYVDRMLEHGTKTIKGFNDEILDIKENIKDAEAALQEEIESVDTTRITKNEDAKAYAIEKYALIREHMLKIENLNKDVASREAQIAKYEGVLAKLEA